MKGFTDMFSLLWKWLVSIFTADKIGVVVRKLLLSAGKPVLKDFLFNTENQKKALEFVKELSKRDDLKGWEKAEMFNAKFLHWLGVGAKEVSTSMLNCLREMALAAFTSDQDSSDSSAE